MNRVLTRVFCFLCFISLSVIPPVLFAAKARVGTDPGGDSGIIPHPFTAHYRFTRNKMHLIDMKRRLTRLENGQYAFRTRSTPVGLLSIMTSDTITESSTAVLSEGRVRPLHYVYRHRSNSRPENIEYRFDWNTMRVTGQAKKNRPVARKFSAHISDPLLYQLAMMQDLMQGKHTLSYQVVNDKGRLEEFVFDVAGEEILKTSAGRLEAVKLVRRNDSSRQTQIWCAKKFNYLPVLVKQKLRDGTRMDLEVTGFSGLPWADRP